LKKEKVKKKAEIFVFFEESKVKADRHHADELISLLFDFHLKYQAKAFMENMKKLKHEFF
jgi:hypothetical protein